MLSLVIVVDAMAISAKRHTLFNFFVRCSEPAITYESEHVVCFCGGVGVVKVNCCRMTETARHAGERRLKRFPLTFIYAVIYCNSGY